MPWEFIEERLGRRFTVKISLPNGCVLFPDNPIDIDEWLTSAAETDEELRELEIPRIRFLQNRWPMQRFARFEWLAGLSVTRRNLWALYVQRRAYVLFSDGFEHRAIAAIEPRDEAALYGFVIRWILSDWRLTPKPPTRVQTLLPGFKGDDSIIEGTTGRPFPDRGPHEKRSFSQLLLNWVEPWLHLPVGVGYWSEEDADAGLKAPRNFIPK